MAKAVSLVAHAPWIALAAGHAVARSPGLTMYGGVVAALGALLAQPALALAVSWRRRTRARRSGSAWRGEALALVAGVDAGFRRGRVAGGLATGGIAPERQPAGCAGLERRGRRTADRAVADLAAVARAGTRAAVRLPRIGTRCPNATSTRGMAWASPRGGAWRSGSAARWPGRVWCPIAAARRPGRGLRVAAAAAALAPATHAGGRRPCR